MVADGLSFEDLRRKRKHRKGHSLIPLAMTEHCRQGYKNIAIDAALGKPEAYGPFLRMMADAHTILQPAKDEVARAQDQAPFPGDLHPGARSASSPDQRFGLDQASAVAARGCRFNATTPDWLSPRLVV